MNETVRPPLAASDPRHASVAGAAWVLEALEAGVAVISLGPSQRGRIEFANTTLAAMVGATVEELLGQPCTQLVTPTDREQARRYFDQIAGGKLRQFVCHLAGPDGTALVADVQAQVVRIDGDSCAVLEFRRWRSPHARELRGPHSLRLDLARCEVRVSETAVPLSRTQFDVLAVLLERRGEVVSHAGLARAAWGVQQVGSSRNFIEAAISRLRRAMQGAGATAVIETVAGHGYMIR